MADIRDYCDCHFMRGDLEGQRHQNRIHPGRDLKNGLRDLIRPENTGSTPKDKSYNGLLC